jgi:phosphatidylinositol glycan class C protein
MSNNHHKLILPIASRPRPNIVTLCLAALPISQHLAVIALFLAVFRQLLIGGFGAGEVGWSCVGLGIGGYVIRRLGWDRPIKQGDTRMSRRQV